jgi:hypothetical protein
MTASRAVWATNLRAKIASNEVKRRTFLRELLRDGRSDAL